MDTALWYCVYLTRYTIDSRNSGPRNYVATTNKISPTCSSCSSHAFSVTRPALEV